MQRREAAINRRHWAIHWSPAREPGDLHMPHTHIAQLLELGNQA